MRNRLEYHHGEVLAVIQADDYDAALAIVRACPGDNVIEIREMAGYA